MMNRVRTMLGQRLVVGLIVASCATVAVAPARADVAAWLVMDVERGEVLRSSNAGRSWPPASTTKMMTAYVVFKAVREGRIALTDPVVMSRAADRVPYGMGFKSGVGMSLDSAIKMMIVKSANDVSHAIAEAISGTEPAFVAEMNAVSRQLGMSRSVWQNPHGLGEAGQVTTARDMAVLTYSLWHDFPEYRHYFAVPAIQHGRKVHRSRNRLIGRYPGVVGMKTGYICDSGNNTVTAATNGRRTIAVITLGARGYLERAIVTRRLLDVGFKRRRGQPLERFSAVEGAELRMVSRYCKSWGKPTPEQLMAEYSGPDRGRGPVVSFLALGQTTIDPALASINDEADTDSAYVAEVLEKLVGVDRGVTPVPVHVGLNKGALPTTLAVIPKPKPWGRPSVRVRTLVDGGEGSAGLTASLGSRAAATASLVSLPGVPASAEPRANPPVVGTPAPGMPVPRPRPAR